MKKVKKLQLSRETVLNLKDSSFAKGQAGPLGYRIYRDFLSDRDVLPNLGRRIKPRRPFTPGAHIESLSCGRTRSGSPRQDGWCLGPQGIDSCTSRARHLYVVRETGPREEQPRPESRRPGSSRRPRRRPP